jgi:hypothetical protein
MELRKITLKRAVLLIIKEERAANNYINESWRAPLVLFLNKLMKVFPYNDILITVTTCLMVRN